MYRKKQVIKTCGFTLIELLVVVSIIALLSSITLVSIDNARTKARIVSLNLNIKSLFNEAAIYHIGNNGFIATPADGPCGTLSGFLATERSQEILEEVASIAKIATNNVDFYCSVEKNEWSLAISVAEVTRNDDILCAATKRGQIITISNDSNDNEVAAYLTEDNCSL